MYSYSERSKAVLSTCHNDLQQVFYRIIMYYDCTIISGYRTNCEQDELFRTGLSKKKGGESNHNTNPSKAVDVAPYDPEIKGIDWEDYYAFYHFAGFVLGMASGMGIYLRWGGDWDSDKDLHDQTFMDLGHFELVKG